MTVSIVLPFYNRAATLRRSIESARAQTITDWELIAVDDGSTDASLEILRAIRDPRIRVLQHPANRGAGPARDTALAAAKGDWVALLDSDDEWLPQKLAVQLQALARQPGATLCSCRYEFRRDGQIEVLPKAFDGALEKALQRQCTFGFGSTLLIRRDVAQELGAFDVNLPRHEDWDWVLRAAQRGHTLTFVEETLVRVHAVDRPRVEIFAPSTERFLAKHDANFRAAGKSDRQRIVAAHYESVASMAYEQRRYALGHRALLRSFRAWPWRSPLPLAALPLSLIDRLLGTRLIQHGANLSRAIFQR